MGTCQECMWSYTNDWGFLYCSVVENSSGGDLRVKSNGTCNRFSARPTSGNSGYKGGSGCFLTSACVDYFGKADDCYELTTLRQFRDHYLKKTTEGVRLVEEYYAVAPIIVEKINLSAQKAAYYTYIYDKIKKCIAHIEQGANEKALDIYREMVQYLQAEVG